MVKMCSDLEIVHKAVLLWSFEESSSPARVMVCKLKKFSYAFCVLVIFKLRVDVHESWLLVTNDNPNKQTQILSTGCIHYLKHPKQQVTLFHLLFCGKTFPCNLKLPLNAFK